MKHLLYELFGVKCKSVKYLSTELIKDNFFQKVGIVDLLLEVDGEIVILEMQNIDRHNFKERIIFYSSNIISKYCLKKGEDYYDLKPIKVYAIINYDGLNEKALDVINLKNGVQKFTDNLEYQIFDLTKEENKDKELVKLFTENDITVLEKTIKGEINKEILEKIKKFNLDWKEYKKMEDIVEMLRNETEHYETAEKVGTIKGELKKQNEIAKNMLEENMSIKLIAKLTGLTNKQILALK